MKLAGIATWGPSLAIAQLITRGIQFNDEHPLNQFLLITLTCESETIPVSLRNLAIHSPLLVTAVPERFKPTSDLNPIRYLKATLVMPGLHDRSSNDKFTGPVFVTRRGRVNILTSSSCRQLSFRFNLVKL